MTWSVGLLGLHLLLADRALAEEAAGEIGINPGGFAAWRQGVLDARGTVDVTRLVDPHVRPVPPRQFIFARAFARAAAVDPELATLVLDGMLDPDPRRRWQLATVAAALPPPDPAALAALLAPVAEADATRRAALAALTACWATRRPPATRP